MTVNNKMVGKKVFVFYKNGEIELVEKDENGKVLKYIAHWANRTEFDESMGEEN